MKYENAKDIFPEALLHDMQKYAEGKIVYIPISSEKRSWGENSGYRGFLEKRNRDIRDKFCSGIEIGQLSEEYFLSVETIKKIVYSKKARETMEDYVLDQTQTFEITITKEPSICEILNTAYFAMKEKGYDPINQLIGYIVTGDSGFITNHKNARNLICNSDRDDLLRVVLSKYFVC